MATKNAAANDLTPPLVKRIVVNDIHTKLNPTPVDRIVPVRSTDDARTAILAAGDVGKVICVSGGRHSMGCLQSAVGGILLDTQVYSGVRRFDRQRWLIEVESGLQWPELIAWLVEHQASDKTQCGIRQKQTG